MDGNIFMYNYIILSGDIRMRVSFYKNCKTTYQDGIKKTHIRLYI